MEGRLLRIEPAGVREKVRAGEGGRLKRVVLSSELDETLILIAEQLDLGLERELIDTGTDKRFVHRDERGRSTESDDVGRSLSEDRRRDAKNEAKKARAIAATGRAKTRRLAARCWRGPGPLF